MSLTADDLGDFLASWELALRAERKSPRTVLSYGDGVRAFLTWAAAEGRSPDLTRPVVAAFIASLLDAGREPTTARARQLSLRRFSAWLTEEGEIQTDELVGMKPPKLDAKLYQPLTDDQVRALLAACQGPGMYDRRDEAIVRLMVETGARAGEVAAMELSDVNLPAGTVVIRRGKGGKGRSVPIGPQTVRAMDRYIRSRRTHRLAKSGALWLGARGRTLGYSGLYVTLRGRARTAGMPDFHPHLLRHTSAHRWLAAGGSEGGLMAVAGWTRPDMLTRYTRARAEERAAEEARRLNLGDL